MQDTYLDPEAMIKRLNDMDNQAHKVYTKIQETQTVMEDLRESFSGTSAMKLQAKYEELANTFSDLFTYFQKKAEEMQILTGNVQNADEE